MDGNYTTHLNKTTQLQMQTEEVGRIFGTVKSISQMKYMGKMFREVICQHFLIKDKHFA